MERDDILENFQQHLVRLGCSDISAVVRAMEQIKSLGTLRDEEWYHLKKIPFLYFILWRLYGSIYWSDIEQVLDQRGESVQDFVDGLVRVIEGGVTFTREEEGSDLIISFATSMGDFPMSLRLRAVCGDYTHLPPLPPFDARIERVAPARSPEAPVGAFASGDFGKVEIKRKSVSVEEVIAKIEKALEKE